MHGNQTLQALAKDQTERQLESPPPTSPPSTSPFAPKRQELNLNGKSWFHRTTWQVELPMHSECWFAVVHQARPITKLSIWPFGGLTLWAHCHRDSPDIPQKVFFFDFDTLADTIRNPIWQGRAHTHTPSISFSYLILMMKKIDNQSLGTVWDCPKFGAADH